MNFHNYVGAIALATVVTGCNAPKSQLPEESNCTTTLITRTCDYTGRTIEKNILVSLAAQYGKAKVAGKDTGDLQATDVDVAKDLVEQIVNRAQVELQKKNAHIVNGTLEIKLESGTIITGKSDAAGNIDLKDTDNSTQWQSWGYGRINPENITLGQDRARKAFEAIGQQLKERGILLQGREKVVFAGEEIQLDDIARGKIDRLGWEINKSSRDIGNSGTQAIIIANDYAKGKKSTFNRLSPNIQKEIQEIADTLSASRKLSVQGKMTISATVSETEYRVAVISAILALVAVASIGIGYSVKKTK